MTTRGDDVVEEAMEEEGLNVESELDTPGAGDIENAEAGPRPARTKGALLPATISRNASTASRSGCIERRECAASNSSAVCSTTGTVSRSAGRESEKGGVSPFGGRESDKGGVSPSAGRESEKRGGTGDTETRASPDGIPPEGCGSRK